MPESYGVTWVYIDMRTAERLGVPVLPARWRGLSLAELPAGAAAMFRAFEVVREAEEDRR